MTYKLNCWNENCHLTGINKMCLQIIYLIYVYKQDLALNN